ncbi:metallophosphoesterase family protein [Rubellimicrobium aerolatum]|uniref:Metallophosphoesterase family protein n=1 Tax=Rubellimicrobium aerolatum TaxID=490979 RepID=A0ABW0S9Z4_9RHOB|nr:metallophosphoesterase [Rubellimicrobium aerolatum]MBP1805137.1 3',5'-cyclic AMP phosphodiesterase CpdA [Rubellimicrobium aerolatum]
MRRVLHLSDLHFGRTRPDLVDPLVALVEETAPDLVAISGDFTQRARRGQYVEAAAFLDRLRSPWLAVPGNHDVSLDNVLVRLLDPWGRYRSFIHEDLAPRHEDEEMTVLGVNTVNRYAHQSGRIGRSQLRAIATAFRDNPQKTVIVVMHHPPEHPDGSTKRPMRHSAEGVAALRGAGADIVLSGHLHNAHVAPLTAAPGVLLVQAGTGLSTRLRQEPNTLNLLTIEPGLVRVDRYAAFERPAFEVAESAWFGRDPADPGAPWRALPDTDGPRRAQST